MLVGMLRVETDGYVLYKVGHGKEHDVPVIGCSFVWSVLEFSSVVSSVTENLDITSQLEKGSEQDCSDGPPASSPTDQLISRTGTWRHSRSYRVVTTEACCYTLESETKWTC